MEEAVAFATAVHEGQKRESGEPYIIHPIAVAEYLMDMGMDSATVIAGVLHDTVEDGRDISLDEISRRFSPEVAHLVDGVTKLTRSGQKEYVTKKQEQNENLTKLFLAIADDVRVVIIKLADRLHNMHTLEYCTREKQIRKAKETLEVYTPLAHRFGIGVLRSELEDLSFKYLLPEEYERIKSLVSRQQEERLKLLGTAMERMKELMKDAGIDAELSGRPKHLYSTYRKMQRNNVGIGEIYDLIAIRVIVNTVNDCYAALGIIHAEWKPLPGRFKDYIAMPKPNLYRSLHTTLMNKNGIPFEVQIRTHEMHETAEYGVAAHWMYKEGRTVQTEMDKRTSWLRHVVDEARDNSEDSSEFAENVVKDYLGEYVYVLTPKGEILDLPIGSTPLDFAYRIHTNVGHHTQHARVNGNMVRLDYTLKTNDVVEIITSNTQAGPSRDWLNIVKPVRQEPDQAVVQEGQPGGEHPEGPGDAGGRRQAAGPGHLHPDEAGVLQRYPQAPDPAFPGRALFRHRLRRHLRRAGAPQAGGDEAQGGQAGGDAGAAAERCRRHPQAPQAHFPGQA